MEISEIRETLLSNVSDEFDKNEGYLIYDILNAVSFVFEELGIKQDKIESMLNIENLSGDELERFIYQRKGIERTAATYAKGVVTVEGQGLIEVGDLFETEHAIQFRATEQTEVNGSADVPVQCTVVGSAGNVPASQITMIPVTLSGITAVTNSSPTSGGYEAESDESLLNRYYILTKTPPTSGNIYHYQQWALSVSGVGAAKIFPLERGINTVEVVIIDQDKKPAAPELVQRVQEYIDPNSEGLGKGEAPIGAKCFITAATPLELTIAVKVTKTSSVLEETVKANIEKSINSYLKDIAFESNYVSYAKIGEAIISAEGVEDYTNLTVNGGTANVNVGTKEVAILGGVTIA